VLLVASATSGAIPHTRDLTGNRTSQTVDGQAGTLSYSPSSNRLTASSGTSAITYSHDNAGNLIGDGTATYTYSGRNRLTEVKQGANVVARYQHNGFGERVMKTLGGTAGPSTLFRYDEDGHLLGEYDGSGNLIQETVWLDDTPVATLMHTVPNQPIGASNPLEVYLVWADHLDTPRVITTSDAANTTVWTWDSDPFGTAQAAGSIAYNLRFPGQYFDAETGTHYNYFRDYDPAAGRYRQADPMGLADGPNRYAYAGSDPLVWLDDGGLRRWRNGRGQSARGPQNAGVTPKCDTCQGVNRNRNDYDGLTNVYSLRGPNGEIVKIGKGSGPDPKRCETQARRMRRSTGMQFECEIRRFFCGTLDATKYEDQLQDRLRRLGNSLPGNAPRPRPR
jgi:RHS repeat-associated protein